MPRQAQAPTASSLSPEAFEAELSDLFPGEASAQPKTISAEEFEAGIADVYPKKPNLLRAAAGAALETLATVPELGGIAARKLGRATGLSRETPFFDEWAGGLRGAAALLDPAESRGRGGVAEDISRAAGGIVGSAPAMALGPGASAIQFGAQSGVPLYHDIKQATGGDEEAATWGLLFGGAVGQLERFGAEKALSSIVKKLSGKGLSEAVQGIALRSALGGAAGAASEAGTELAQTAAEVQIYNALTDDERDAWEEMKRALPPALLLGGAFGAVDAAIQRGKAAATQPEATDGTPATPAAGPAETQSAGISTTSSTAQGAPSPPSENVAVASPETLPALVESGSPEAMDAPSGGQVSRESLTGDAPPRVSGSESESQPSTAQSTAAGTPEPEVRAPKPDADPDEDSVSLYAGLPPLYAGSRPATAAESKSKLKRIGRSVVDGLLSTHGAKPEAAALLEERARGEVEVEASRARSGVLALKRAVSAFNRANPKAKVTNGAIRDALTSPEKMAALPDAVRPAAERLRTHADSIARTLVDEGIVSTTLAETIEGRMGEYLRRSYKAHSDPKWAEKVPQDVRNRLESLLVSWSQPLSPEGRKALAKRARAGDREAQFEVGARRGLKGKSVEDIRAEMKRTLADARNVAENPWRAFAKSKLKRKDVSLFKRRKGLPVELRDFLGEEKDPYANYTETILRQASFVAAHRKFQKMRAEGLGKWLFEKPTEKDGKEYVERVSAEDNPRLSPLVGDKEIFTTKEIKRALFDSDRQMTHFSWRAAMVANAILKGAKTVYRPDAAPRQAASQISALVRNGHAGTAIRRWREIVGGMYGKGDAGKKLHERLLALQVLDSSVAAAEFKDVQEIKGNRRLNEPYRSALKANEWAGWLFSQPDNFSKTAGWIAETEILVKRGVPREKAEEEAANIVKNIYPTYSRIVPWVDKYRRQPFIGTFVAFKAEQIRTKIEVLRLIQKERNSNDPAERAQARKRVAWQLAGHSLAPAGAIAWNMLNGVDQEEDEARRDRMQEKQPYDAQRTLAWVDDGDGYVDLSDVDDGAWITDPLMRVAAGEDVDAVVVELFNENVRPFFELSLFSEAAVDFVRGRNKYGGEVDNRLQDLFERVKPRGFDPRNFSGFRINKRK